MYKRRRLEFWFTPYFEKSSHVMPLISLQRKKIVLVTIPVIPFLLVTLVPEIRNLTEMLFVPFYKIHRCYFGNRCVNDLFCNAPYNKIIKTLAVQYMNDGILELLNRHVWLSDYSTMPLNNSETMPAALNS